jgi:large repetitive protein
MLLSHRLALLAVFSLPVLSACGSSSHGSESGTSVVTSTGGTTPPMPPVTPPKTGPGSGSSGGAPGDHNDVAATASVGAPFVVSVGASQTITVTFTSSDGATLSAFSAYGSLGAFPAGWSSPSSLTCGIVGPGSGCVMTLTYAPTAVETGTLSLTCVFVDNAGLSRTPGPCLTLSYAAAVPNNVVASVSPAGEIDASVGARQPVSVNFITDDGNAATAFSVAVGALPSGWSTTSSGLSCAVVGTGNGCQLPLQFGPTGPASGTLSLTYSYTDSAGASRTGSLNIPYATASNGSVVTSFSPNGQVTAAKAGGTQTVAVNFSTVGGKTASGLGVLTDLSKLPAGWSSKSTAFTCATVSAGNGCQLQLQYAPAALGSGALNLRYEYSDAGGNPNFGVVNIPYAATTDDNAVATVAPTGQFTAMLGAAAQPVSVTFTSDDARLATSLQITSDLTTLPPGWSAAGPSFACAAFDTGSSCDLQLTYLPTGVDNGTLTLNYSYLNNANETKTGSIAIPYQTTTNDNVNGAVLPGSVTVASGGTASATVTFTTDDGNFASGLSADLSTLPAGWTGPASLSCPSVSTGNACSVVLSYAPTAAASGTLSFGYSYTNSAATAKTGTVSFMYTATP